MIELRCYATKKRVWKDGHCQTVDYASESYTDRVKGADTAVDIAYRWIADHLGDKYIEVKLLEVPDE